MSLIEFRTGDKFLQHKIFAIGSLIWAKQKLRFKRTNTQSTCSYIDVNLLHVSITIYTNICAVLGKINDLSKCNIFLTYQEQNKNDRKIFLKTRIPLPNVEHLNIVYTQYSEGYNEFGLFQENGVSRVSKWILRHIHNFELFCLCLASSLKKLLFWPKARGPNIFKNEKHHLYINFRLSAVLRVVPSCPLTLPKSALRVLYQ